MEDHTTGIEDHTTGDVPKFKRFYVVGPAAEKARGVIIRTTIMFATDTAVVESVPVVTTASFDEQSEETLKKHLDTIRDYISNPNKEEP